MATMLNEDDECSIDKGHTDQQLRDEHAFSQLKVSVLEDGCSDEAIRGRSYQSGSDLERPHDYEP